MLRTYLVVFMLLIGSVLLNAQGAVDIASTQARIDVLKSQNETLSSEITQLSTSNNTLLEEKRQNETSIFQMNAILTDLKTKSAIMLVYWRNIYDTTAKAQAKEAYDKSVEAINRLTRRIFELTIRNRQIQLELDRNFNSIYVKQAAITRNSLDIKRMSDLIGLTGGQTGIVEDYIKAIDEISARVQTLTQ